MSAKAKSRNKPASGSTSTEPTTAPEPLVFTAPAEPIADGSAVLEVPAPEAESARPPLVIRIKEATGKAVSTSFASLRTAQATAVKRALELVTKVDAALSKSLASAEKVLLTALETAPAAPAEPTPAEA